MLHRMKWPCPEPFVSFTTRALGSFSSCCVADDNVLLDLLLQDPLNTTKEEKELLINYTGTPEEKYRLWEEVIYRQPYFVNNTTGSAYLKSKIGLQIKKAFLDNDRSILDKFCKTCVVQECSGVKSHRQHKLESYDMEAFKQAADNYTEVPTTFNTVNLTGLVGNVCNLACSMCASDSSSKYASEAMALGELYAKKAIRKIPTSPELIDDLIYNILPKSKTLKFTGGEPLLSKDMFKLLSQLSDETKSNLKLHISTNLTRDPTEFIKATAAFKHVKLHISIEGVRDVQEYIRYPSRWSDIVENCKKLKTARNIETLFVATVNALNIGYNYQIAQEYKTHVSGVSFGSLVTNNFYSINSIPPDIQNKYLNKLYSHGSKSSHVKDMIKLLEDIEYNEREMWAMLSHIKKRDRLRRKSLVAIFPEWEYYYHNADEFADKEFLIKKLKAMAPVTHECHNVLVKKEGAV